MHVVGVLHGLVAELGNEVVLRVDGLLQFALLDGAELVVHSNGLVFDSRDDGVGLLAVGKAVLAAALAELLLHSVLCVLDGAAHLQRRGRALDGDVAEVGVHTSNLRVDVANGTHDEVGVVVCRGLCAERSGCGCTTIAVPTTETATEQCTAEDAAEETRDDTAPTSVVAATVEIVDFWIHVFGFFIG